MSTLTRITTVSAIAAITAFTMTACGGGSASDSPSQQPSQAQPSQPAAFPGANGRIASISGSSFQVQSDTAQTQVTYTGSTQITQTTTVSLKYVKAGDCITASGANASDGAITAQIVNVSAPVNGECQQNFPGGGNPGGSRPNGAPSDFPGGGTPPSGFPSGGPGGGGFTMASGKVTSVSDTSIVVNGELNTISSNGPSSSPGSITVTLAADGSVTKEDSADPSVITVGQCARAIGEANDKGAIAATSINVSAPINGDCRGGMGGFGGGRPAS